MKFDTVSPCKSCPYRKDAPLGLWHPDEFENLARTEHDPTGVVFACHGSAKKPELSVCAGWFLKQKEASVPSLALRLVLMRSPEAREAFRIVNDGDHPLYSSVEDMIDANESLGRCRRCGRYQSIEGRCPVHGPRKRKEALP